MSETLSLVPGSLIQFHTIPLDWKKFAYALMECSFWARPDLRESTEEQKVTKLIPLSNLPEERPTQWSWREPIKGVVGKDEQQIRACRDFPNNEIIKVKLDDVLKTCVNQWIPLPWLVHWENEKGSEFSNYPSNWVRGCLRYDAGNKRLSLELAFDTSIDLSQDNSDKTGNMLPTLDDVQDDKVFRMPSDPNWLRNWLTENFWVREWMSELYQTLQNRTQATRTPVPVDPAPDDTQKFRPDAIWLAFAQTLSKAGDLPKSKFVKLDRSPPIEVDLVLDLGNFRSCGVLIEQMPDRAISSSNGLENCSLLEICDLAYPSNRYKGIFPSRVEFGKASFGLDHRSRASGRSSAFYWPGQVRVGQQAERMLVGKRGTEGRSGLATPKRYLWSRDPWMNGWNFNTADNYPSPTDEQPVTGSFRRSLKELLTTPEKWGEDWSMDDLPTVLSYDGDEFEARGTKSAGSCILSRSQLFILMVEEMVLHAIRFMNDPDQRAKRGLEGTPRHLRSVVFTMPPGMALAERRIFLERVKAGVCFAWQQAEQNTLWKAAGWKDPNRQDDTATSPLSVVPKVECDLDEATATQLVWLENEIVSRMGGNVKEFFRLYGTTREVTESLNGRKKQKDTIRVASLDIGGGTTDMMVATYAREESDALTPTQNFRESFQLAGDNLLEKVTSDIVLKQAIAPVLRDAGVPNPEALLRQLFKFTFTDVRDEAARHLLVSILLEPAGLKVLEIYENVPLYVKGVIGSFTLGSTDNASPADMLDFQWQRCQAFLRKYLSQHYADCKTVPSPEMSAFLTPPPANAVVDEDDTPPPTPFDLRKTVVTVDTEEVDKCIQSALGQTLKQFSAAIRAYGCDVMLLSGRPSKLRHVSDIITAQLPVMPQRIIRMHDYGVSRAYPFSDVNGKINDPKTTVVSGAAIWKLAGQKRLLNFTLRTEELKMKSTVNYIGIMQAGAGTVAEALNTKPLDLETPAKNKTADDEETVVTITNFENEIHLGWRQLPNPSWTATPLYRIRYRDNGLALMAQQNLSQPYTLTLKQEQPRLDEDLLLSQNRMEALRQKKMRDLQQEDLVLNTLVSSITQDAYPNPRDVLEIQLMTSLDPRGHWRDTGCLTLDW